MQADPIPQLFDEWAASYARGERPDPRPFLARAGEGRDELSALMERFLQAAPRPQPTDEDVELVRAWMRGDSPLAEIRSRRGITRDQLVIAIQERFDLRDDQRAEIKDYYHQLESGLISPRRLSARLVQFLSEMFGVGASAITGSEPRRIAAPAAFRVAASVDEMFLDDAALAIESPIESDSEVRALFLSNE